MDEDAVLAFVISCAGRVCDEAVDWEVNCGELGRAVADLRSALSLLRVTGDQGFRRSDV